jgi:Kef-type K+ transport system membrane component KefB
MGKLLLMFFAGFEVNMAEFKKNRHRALFFGMTTFLFPFSAGFAIAQYFDYSVNASVLIGSLLASHTLLGFPIVKKLGLANSEPVLVTISGTIITDVLAMLILAICLPIHQAGFSLPTLALQLGQLAIYIPAILFGLSWIAHKLLHYYGDSEEARVTILFILIAVAAELAEFIHLEAIIGAFLTGIAVKRAVNDNMVETHLDIMSQAFFIPAFFLTTGFLIDFQKFGRTVVEHPVLVIAIVSGLLFAKYLATWITAKVFNYSTDERNLMWGLSIPQVAATLAATVVAFKTFNSAGEPLIDEPVLNAVLVLVMISAVTGTIVTGHYAKRLLSDKNQELTTL